MCINAKKCHFYPFIIILAHKSEGSGCGCKIQKNDSLQGKKMRQCPHTASMYVIIAIITNKICFSGKIHKVSFPSTIACEIVGIEYGVTHSTSHNGNTLKTLHVFIAGTEWVAACQYALFEVNLILYFRDWLNIFSHAYEVNSIFIDIRDTLHITCFMPQSHPLTLYSEV